MTALLVLAGVAGALASPLWVPMLRWYRTARSLGVPHPLRSTAETRLLRVDPSRVYGAMLRCRDAGVPLEMPAARSHLLAGGNLERVVDALVLARAQGVPLDFTAATALDLSGRNPLTIVRDGPRTADGRIDYARVLGGGIAAPRLPDAG